MVPKPDGSKRMCIDYRNLNDCTPDAYWPIPNIAEMLRRIGNHKPKIFGTMCKKCSQQLAAPAYPLAILTRQDLAHS